MLSRIKKLLSDKDERNLIYNILMAFGVKGISLFISLFSMPLYIKYFDDDAALGIWYTILSMISWINLCDLGLGNGLRNKLTEMLAKGNQKKARECISSTYAALSVIIIPVFLLLAVLLMFVDLNSFFNISSKVIDNRSLLIAMLILLFGIAVHFIIKLINNVIYAIQKSSMNNVLSLFSSALPLLYVFAFPGGDIGENLIRLSVVHAISINLPLLVASIVLFRTRMLKDCAPSFRFVKFSTAKEMLNFGMQFFLAQIFFMFLISTNEVFITKMFSPDDVVNYSIYYRLFTAVGSLFMLALTPMWSKITKDIAQKNYRKIRATNHVLYGIASIAVVGELLMVPILQILINIWLGEKAIAVNYVFGLVFAVFGGLYILNVVLTTVANGMGDLKSQIVFYGIGSVLKIPVLLVLKIVFDSWIVVVAFNAAVLLVFCLYQLLWVEKKINKLIRFGGKENG